MSSTMHLDIHKIRRDGGTQSRAELNQDIVDTYAAAMFAGETFPPVKLFYDGTDYWLADGFHRVAASIQLNATTIFADVYQGTQRDAILDSVAANSKHGLQRSRDDTRRAIATLLNDEQWGKWSDREIARRVVCDHKTVASERAKLSGEIPQTRTVERNGTIYEMTRPTVVNSRGKGFAIGDVVRFSEQNIWEYNYGQIADINGEDVILNFAIKSSRARYSEPETLIVSRLKLFPITQSGYQRWFCQALYQEQVVLFAWKDHYISFDTPRELNAGGHNWTRSDGDIGLAWRVHPAWLEHWSQQKTSYVVVKQEAITPEMLDIVGRAGRARGGSMVMPPQPEPEKLPMDNLPHIDLKHQPDPSATITDAYGEVFKLYDVISFPVPSKITQGMFRRLVGRIDELDANHITIGHAIEPLAPHRVAERHTLTVEKGKRWMRASDKEWLGWYFSAHHAPNTMVLFKWEERLIGFWHDRQLHNPLNTEGVISADKSIFSTFFVHPSYVDYWQAKGIEVQILMPHNVHTRMVAIVRAAAKSKAYTNKPPQPETVQPAADPSPAKPESTERTAFQVGDTVLTRTRRQGEVIESNGLVRVKTASYTSNHDPSKLTLVLRAPAAPPPAAPMPEPFVTQGDLTVLENSLKVMFTFIETGLLPDRGTLPEHLKQIRLAVLRTELEFYKRQEQESPRGSAGVAS